MSPQRVLLVTASVLAAIGLIVGFVPVSTVGGNCGSVFSPSPDAVIADLLSPGGAAQARCDSMLSVVRIPVVVLLVLGDIAFVAAMVVGHMRSSSSPS